VSNKNHALRFALYRQVVRAVDFGEYLSDREIAAAVGVSVDHAHNRLSELRRRFPTLVAAFDAIRHNGGAFKDKFGADAIQPLDEIIA
jgi:hypothetical protein